MIATLFSIAIHWIITHMNLSDISIALLSSLLLTSLLQKLVHFLRKNNNKNKNSPPYLWPFLGIIPTLFLHLNDLLAWATTSLIAAGGTFHYRGIFLAGAHGIITADPLKLEHMLKTKFNNFPKGKYYREIFQELLGDGIFNADGELWRQQRRVAVIEMHSNKFLDHSFETIQELVHNKLLKLMEIKSFSYSDSVIDLQEVLLRFTFDNICISALGVNPGCLSVEFPNIPFAKAFEEATEDSLFRFLLPPFLWKLNRFLDFGSEKRLKEAVSIVHEFAEKTVKERRNEIKSNPISSSNDLLSRLILKDCFSDELLEDFCISFILAGRDTSSVGLAWFFWLIHKNPQVESRILSEIEQVIGRRSHRTTGQDKRFTAQELKEMVYLQASISESLRLYPPVPLDLKQVAEDDEFEDGTRVKKGGRIVYCIYSMARMEPIWGKDCMEFKPERWINKDDGEFVSENQFKYPVFNAGPRLCIGKKFAYTQMKLVAASVLWRYSVEVVDGHPVVPKVTTTLYMKHGLKVSLKPRVRR